MIRSLPTPLPIALTTTLALLGGCTGVLEDGPAGSAGSDGPGTGGGGSKGDNLDPDSGMPIDEEPEGPFTHAWYTDIGPILIKNCGSCHQPNGSGPFAMTYELAKAWAPLIKSTTAERTMPPMPVNNDGTCQSFDNARWLTDAEIQAIGEWVDEGAPHGPVTDLASFPADLSLSDPNLTVKMPTAYTPAGNVSDDYRCFPVTPNIANDVFLTSYEVVPQSRRIAHHMILYMVPTNDQSWVTTEDAKSATPGYPCFGTIGSPNGDAAQPVAVWAPGGGRIDFPEGTGVRIPKGRMLVIQMHYNLAQGPDTDLTAVKMKVTNSVAHEAFFFPLADTTFKAPPQMELFKTTPNGASDLLSITDGSFNMLAPMTVYGVFPHMH
ncbi:MAG: hypothetical protein KC417_04850, partial [Myxococcales bacterium]|nr:hypothetical protein [Myxococcales bacterium]